MAAILPSGKVAWRKQWTGTGAFHGAPDCRTPQRNDLCEECFWTRELLHCYISADVDKRGNITEKDKRKKDRIKKDKRKKERTGILYMRNKKKRRWITGWRLAFLLLLAGILGCGVSSANAEYIGIEAAKEAALRAAEVSEEQAVFSDAGLDKKNDIFYYQVIFSVDNVEYEYDIDALTGVVIEAAERTKLQQMQETQNISQTEEIKETISADMEVFGDSGKKEYRNLDSSRALKAALDYAGLTEEEIRSQEVEADEKDGKRVFEIELVSLEGVEYDYEIRAEDGRVLSFDYDAGEFLKENNKASMDTGLLSEEQAKQTALSCVPGAKAEDIVMILKEDDGRMKYKGYLIYEGMQYEFKIDAYSGYLIEWEAESLIP